MIRAFAGRLRSSSGQVRRHSPPFWEASSRRLPAPRAAATASSSNGSAPNEDSISWATTGFPSYMQNQEAKKFPCEEPTVTRDDGTKAKWTSEIQIWGTIREEAQRDALSEPLLSSFLYASILAHETFERSLAFVLANRLANPTMLPTQLFEIFHGVLSGDDDVRCGALADLEACRERDPACGYLCHALLYFKGYHAIQAYRIANALYRRNQKVLAVALQSRMSEVYAVDIHPAARIGKGILLDHGTGVVIGETAVIGNYCSLLQFRGPVGMIGDLLASSLLPREAPSLLPTSGQNVTLGGTGKEIGDRHPKIGNNVLIGASATVLGNIIISDGAQIAAGSLVLKPVPPHTMVAGSPAKPVGTVMGNPAETMLHWREKDNKLLEEPDEASGKKAGGTAKEPASSSGRRADAAGPPGGGLPVLEAAGGVYGALAAASESDIRKAAAAAESNRARISEAAAAASSASSKSSEQKGVEYYI